MIRISSSELFKFLSGILLVQLATGMLLFVAYRTQSHEVWWLLLLLALTLGLLSAFWFSSIVGHAKKEAVAQMREGFSREREKIRVQAEREKNKVLEKSHKQIIQDRRRTQASYTVKSAAMFAVVLGLGGILVFTQFFTFGMLLMSSAGGALGGYLWRSRQLLSDRRRKPALESDQAKSV